MKKLLLSISLFCVALVGTAQVTFTIEEPSSIYGNAEFTFSTAASNWGGPDMTLVANALMDTLMLVDDGSGSINPLACDPLVNDLTGKIAFLYRGSCTFYQKALNAQNAGAVGVVIVTDAGSPATMDGGPTGTNITIPVFMVSQADGALMRGEMDGGADVVVHIYNKTAFYANDLAMISTYTLRPPATSVLAATAVDDTEFNFPLGTWVFNFGQNDIVGAEVTANVDFGGASVFSQVSLPIDINAGDSAYFALPDFQLSTYPVGEYSLSYSVDAPIGEDYSPDNVLEASFLIDDTYYAIADVDATGNTTNLQRSAQTVSTMCTVFRDSNASRRSAVGIGFTAFLPPATLLSLDGEYIEVNAYSWDDQFVDLNDAGFGTTSLNLVGYAEYFYTSNAVGVTQFVEFDDPFMMVDNQRYAFCVTKYTDSILFGSAGNVDYHFNIEGSAQPVQLFYDDAQTQYFVDYSDGNAYSGVVVETGAPFFAGVEETTVDVTPFPNPAMNIVNIPLSGVEGDGSLSIVDLSGKIVLTQTVSVANGSKLAVDVSGLPAGIYVFNMKFDNGTTSAFNVAVTK